MRRNVWQMKAVADGCRRKRQVQIDGGEASYRREEGEALAATQMFLAEGLRRFQAILCHNVGRNVLNGVIWKVRLSLAPGWARRGHVPKCLFPYINFAAGYELG